MIRNKFSGQTTKQIIHAYASMLVARQQMFLRAGYQYGNSRNVYQALGYIEGEIKYEEYLSRYQRQDIAKAIIDRPVKATWQGPLELIESDKAKDTKFETAWRELNRELGLKSRLARVDKLTGIGRYGILVLGLNDVKDIEGFENPVPESSSRERKLLYVQPFGEESAKIDKFVNNPRDKRYGQPLIYSITTTNPDNLSTQTVKVHYSRIVHIVDDNTESDVYGAPRLESVFNRLMDLDKLIGGDAEMFWRGARPGYAGIVDPNFQMNEDTKQDLKNQIDEYEHDLRRILVGTGIELKSLAQQIADPANHVDVIVQMISAETAIPKRILTGSERGELSSAQDSTEWKDYVQARREDHAEPHIIRPFVDRCIELGLLPEPSDDYDVKWSNLYALSEKSRVEIGKGRSNSLREYTTNPIAQMIISPKAFLEKFLGFTTEEITLMQKMTDDEIDEETRMKAIEEANKPPVPAPAFGGGNGEGNKPVKPVTKKKTPVVTK